MSNNYSWNSHLNGNNLKGKDKVIGLVPKLSQRVGMLAKLNKYMTREQFKQTCDGIFTSCLLYCLPLFCNAMDDSIRRFHAFTKNDCRKLQVLQNKVLRLKTKNFEMNTPTQNLLNATGDLSVHQLGAYHTMVTANRIIRTGQPKYLADRLVPRQPQPDQAFPARHSNTISVNCELTLSRCGFLYRAARIWNLMPPTLRETARQEVFKTGLRKWILETIPRKPP